uniref:J domain-containing protein n=1 Tax=Pseudo-nitzschia australis TaxID=44445 RepID=A0A7S4APH0_9STRA|mmetsp:Transcript_8055/g.17342  ORF Transcript_8055/g.17342 Transcript_8055/m.17342 type:complete len:266 (-) Transcript_8055:211-1008(-)
MQEKQAKTMAHSVLSRKRRRRLTRTIFSTTRSLVGSLGLVVVALASIAATGLLFVARPSTSFSILYSFPNSSLWRERYGSTGDGRWQHGHGGGGSDDHNHWHGHDSGGTDYRHGQQQRQDHYGVLGVGKNAGKDEIKTAFRRLVKEYHPDANPNRDTAEQFRIVNKAYETLLDPTKRRKYNFQMYNHGYSADTPNFIIDALEDDVYPSSVPQQQRSTSRNTPATMQHYQKPIRLAPNEYFNGSLLKNDKDYYTKETDGRYNIRSY